MSYLLLIDKLLTIKIESASAWGYLCHSSVIASGDRVPPQDASSTDTLTKIEVISFVLIFHSLSAHWFAK
jgi:hypothetical protein